MRSAAVATLVALAALAGGAEPPVPAPKGYVTDLAGVVRPETARRIADLVEELRAKTGGEIAVVTVETTAPLDDFTYAMRIADAWKPGRKGEDTGVVFLVATHDRKVRIVVGYGLEGILPDGLVGQIEDEAIVPAFRAGRIDEGIWQGVAEIARRIAAAHGVELTGVPPPRERAPASAPLPGWAILLIAVLVIALVIYQAIHPPRFRRGGFSPFGFGGFGGGGFGDGGFGGGGGGFGGFGGGSFGGGGAGRSW